MQKVSQLVGKIFQPKIDIPENYASLHVHSHYSLLDGMCKIPELVKRTKELGMTSIALTEHGHLGSALALREECKKQGIKPINGIELYMTTDMSEAAKPVEERDRDTIKKMIEAKLLEDKSYTEKEIAKIKKSDKNFDKYSYDMRQYHLILLAMNQTGWNNLVKIQSIAAAKCTYNGRFLADPNLLRKYNEGIICTSACIGGIIPSLIAKHKVKEAKEWVMLFKDIFQDRFYLEIQPVPLPKQLITNVLYCQWSKELNIKLVATTDTHYIYKEDHDDHDTYLCIAIGKKKSDTDRMKYTNNYWLHSTEEFIESFQTQEDYLGDKKPEDYTECWIQAIKNTKEIEARIESDILIGSKLPLYPKVINLPHGMTSDELLYSEVWKGYIKYKAEMDAKGTPIDEKIYMDRMYEEMRIITAKHYSDYFLIVQEYVIWGNSINPETGREYNKTGPGRGSAAGSLVLFFLGVTKADPIKYNLLFSRFLTIDRTEVPDVDLDWEDREAAIRHLEDVYGNDHVAYIGTWTAESAYSGIKDFARVLDLPFDESNAINKSLQEIIDTPGVKFEDFDALKETDPIGYKKFAALEDRYANIFRLARKFEGCYRQWGTHASGILVMPQPITDMFPVRLDSKTGAVVTLYTGTQLEACGSVKFDFLGLATISIFEKTLQAIGMSWDELYKNTDGYDNPEVYKMLQAGKTEGVFQFESQIMTSIIKDVRPLNLEDLTAITSVARPGPLKANYHKLYAECRRKGNKAYPIRDCEDILDVTNSVIVYQEQLMAISKKIAGFDDRQADSITRKVTAKKKIAMFPMMIRCHIYGKKNCDGPDGWEDNDKLPWYDPKGKYGGEISGALVNGYTEQDVKNYFDKIMGFASYAFNKAHALTYSMLSYMGAWLKYYYPAQYMAAVLSLQKTSEDIAKYVKVCQDMGITVKVPDINLSGENFTAIDNTTITYGLSSVKGVNNVSDIIANRPYTGIEDAIKKLPKKSFNKTVGSRLIKCGAFDSLDGENRNATLNKFYELRKDKDREPEHLYTRAIAIAYEIESIGINITFKTAWEKLLPGQRIFNAGVRLLSSRDYKTKKGDLMAYARILYDGVEIPAIVFPKTYKQYNEYLLPGLDIVVSGIRSQEKDELIINQIALADDVPAAGPIPVFDPFANIGA